jgi:alkylation response protein AidB-like acyl-CoA dehydrogenase
MPIEWEAQKMPIPDLNWDLTETEKSVKETVHRFAAEVLRPAGIALDKLTPDEVIAPESVFWEVHRQYLALGIGDAREGMSRTESARLQFLVSEELGWGDSGFAIAFGAGSFPANLAAGTGRPELIEKFPPHELGCWAITEPDHGSDMIDVDDKTGGLRESLGKPNCVARADGNEYVISGQKSAWISNGTLAASAALFTAVENADGSTGSAVFLVPLDIPGVSKGTPTDKMGQRALNQGELFFDEVRVPPDYMVVPPDNYNLHTQLTLAGANTGMGTIFAGVARSAFELALAYAKERKQGGRPIIEHQSVKSRIFEMYRQVECARALNFNVVMLNASSGIPNLTAAIATKVTSTQTAFDVASMAFQIFGGAGMTKEYPIEKIFRDARVSMIEDGCNEVLGMVCAAGLAA